MSSSPRSHRTSGTWREQHREAHNWPKLRRGQTDRSSFSLHIWSYSLQLECARRGHAYPVRWGWSQRPSPGPAAGTSTAPPPPLLWARSHAAVPGTARAPKSRPGPGFRAALQRYRGLGCQDGQGSSRSEAPRGWTGALGRRAACNSLSLRCRGAQERHVP